MIALVGVVCFLSGFGVAAWMGWNFGQNYGVREYRRGQRNAWEWAEHDARVADLRAAHPEVAPPVAAKKCLCGRKQPCFGACR